SPPGSEASRSVSPARGSRAILIVLAALLAVETIAIASLLTRDRWQKQAQATPVVRGAAIAERSGCFGCHGPGGTRPIPNPGAKGGEGPGWPGGTWMMWNRSESDVRAWIVDGHSPGHEDHDEGALLHMPAYGKWLSDGEVDDLVAYVLAVSQF